MMRRFKNDFLSCERFPGLGLAFRGEIDNTTEKNTNKSKGLRSTPSCTRQTQTCLLCAKKNTTVPHCRMLCYYMHTCHIR